MCICPPHPDFANLPKKEGNKNYGFRMMLYCRTGFHLIILPDGTVKGTDEEFHKYGKLYFLLKVTFWNVLQIYVNNEAPCPFSGYKKQTIHMGS